MSAALDSSILIAALNEEDPDHEKSRAVLGSARHSAFSHTLSESFSILTGGKLGFRVPASQAATLLKSQVVPRLHMVSLSPADLLKAYGEAESRGIRGGAIYDYLHLFAARKAGTKVFYTLNLSDFEAFHRTGDPVITGV